MAFASIVISFKHVALFATVALSFITASARVQRCTSQTSRRDCDVFNEVCCNNQCVSGSSCVGQPCSSDSNCFIGESCCNRKCKDSLDCWGSSCSVDSDCGDDICCHGTCQSKYKDCSLSAAAIIGIITGVLIIFIFFIVLAIFLVFRRRRTFYHGGVIRTGQTIVTTIPTIGEIPGPIPPFDQPGYRHHPPHYPPRDYEQPQQPTNVPPPFNPDVVAECEPPPPNAAVVQGGSGGVYTPTYGALPTAPPYPE